MRDCPEVTRLGVISQPSRWCHFETGGAGLLVGAFRSVDVLPCLAGHDGADRYLLNVEHAGEAILRILFLSPPFIARVRRVEASYFPNLVFSQKRSWIGLTFEPF